MIERLIKHAKKLGKNSRDRVLGIALRTAAAFGRPWAIQTLLHEGAKPSERSGTGTSAYDAALIGQFWSKHCNSLIKKGGNHGEAIRLLEITFDAEDEEEKQKFIEISKKFSDAVTIHDNSGNVTLLNEVEGNGIEGSSTDLLKTNIQVSEKDQKHSVKNEDKQKHKKTSVEKTLEFLYSNILKCQSSFVATVLQSLCNLSNDPSCESMLRLHTVRLVLSLCEYAPSEMLRKEIIEHESEDEQRRRSPTNTKTDLSKEQETVSEIDDRNRAGAVLGLFHVRPKKKISAILATLLEQLLAPQNSHDLLTVALQLTWSLLNKDLDYFYPEFLRRGIIEKVEVLHDQAPHSKSLISVCSGAILAMEIDDNDLADGLH